MSTSIMLVAADVVLDGTLDDSETARAIAARLPLKLRMSRWGEEYYGSIGDPLGVEQSADARDLMQVGELAYWPVGNALCVFFGPTPASEGDEPRAASAVNPVGRLVGELDVLRGLGGSIDVTVQEA